MEQDLLERAREGDDEAFCELFDLHLEALQRRVRRDLPARLGRRLSVADVIQEVRMIAFGRLSGFEHRGPGSFRNWVLTIADMKVREMKRRHAGTAKRAAGLEVSRDRRADTANFRAKGPSPSEVAIAGEFAERVRRAMAILPAEQRELIRMVREEGLTLREVAKRTARTREAAKKAYGRAIQHLKRIVEDPGAAP
jgi:RNA polymerase sigma-70 factor (ECF subfamily)